MVNQSDVTRSSPFDHVACVCQLLVVVGLVVCGGGGGGGGSGVCV